jgi:microcystin degradation protein MlrC
MPAEGVPKRVLITGLFHETNTFVEQTTRLSDFQILRGEQLRGCAGDSSPLGGFLEAAKEFGWAVFYPLDDVDKPTGF